MNTDKSLLEAESQPSCLGAVSGSSITDIVYGIGIFLMLIIMVFGAVVYALGY
jgi:hypothetical protein